MSCEVTQFRAYPKEEYPILGVVNIVYEGCLAIKGLFIMEKKDNLKVMVAKGNGFEPFFFHNESTTREITKAIIDYYWRFRNRQKQ